MTYVLVHGGGSTGRYWDRLVPFLDRPALAVDLPGSEREGGGPRRRSPSRPRSRRSSPTSRPPTPRSATGPIVLVAHSSGGLVVPGVVAALAGRVDHVVLERRAGAARRRVRRRLHAGAPPRRAAPIGRDPAPATAPTSRCPVHRPIPKQCATPTAAPPLDDATLAFVVDPVRNVPDTINHYFQPVHWSAAASVPVTYAVNEQDRPIPAPLQDEMIGRLPRATARRSAADRSPGGGDGTGRVRRRSSSRSSRSTRAVAHDGAAARGTSDRRGGVAAHRSVVRTEARPRGRTGRVARHPRRRASRARGPARRRSRDRAHVARSGATATCCACDPRDDPDRPEQGVFGTRSPDRPNPIGLHPVEILAIERNRVHVRDLEALDGTPIVDIKPVLGREFETRRLIDIGPAVAVGRFRASCSRRRRSRRAPRCRACPS